MRNLEHVYVLGDSLDLKVVALHFVMHRQEVKGVPDSAPHLEVGNDILSATLVYSESESRNSGTQVLATMASTNCVVFRLAVSYVAWSARFALWATSERIRTTAVASLYMFALQAPNLVGSVNASP